MEAASAASIFKNVCLVAGGSVAEPLMQLMDTYFVGLLGTKQVAATGPSAVILFAINNFSQSTLLVVATDQLASTKAAGKEKQVVKVLMCSLWITIAIGVLLGCIVYRFSEPILKAVGVEDDIFAESNAFLKIRALSIPAITMLATLEGCYRAILNLKVPFYIVIGLNVCNMMLNPLLIFVFGLDVLGSAYATTLSQICGVVAFLVMLAYQQKEDFGGTSLLRDLSSIPSLVNVVSFVKKCCIMVLRTTLIICMYATAGILATQYGSTILASHQIVRQIQTIQVVITWSYMSVGQSMIANVYGNLANSPESVKHTADKLVNYGSATAVLLGCITLMLRKAMTSAFTNDEEVLGIACKALIPAALMVIASANNAIEGCLLGAGDMKFCSKAFIPAVAFSLCVFYVTKYYTTIKLTGIWWGLFTYYFLLWSIFYCRYKGLLMKSPFPSSKKA